MTLHGVPIVVGRRVDYGRIDPEISRELFIRHALVEGDWDTHHRFFHANRGPAGGRRGAGGAGPATRPVRRRGDARSRSTTSASRPHVVSGRHFDTWWKKALRARSAAGLHRRDGAHRTGRRRRRRRVPGPRRGGRAHAAAVVRVRAGHERRRDHGRRPGAALHQVDPTPFTWQVPGLREELVTALIKTLPKDLRRQFAPAPDHARAVARPARPPVTSRCSMGWSASWAGCAA